MMRRMASAILLAGVFCIIAISADLPDKWRRWRYSRAIEGAAAVRDEPAELTLPWEVYVHCRANGDDVRILNSRSEEVPFVLQEKPVQRNAEAHPARIVENSFVAGNYTQVIGDLGEQHLNYERVKVETNRPDFIVWAEVALSDDAKTWRVVEARAPIARFRSREVEGIQAIPIQGLSSRYVRVRITDPSGQFPVNGVSVLHEESYEFPTSEIPTRFVQENASDPTENVWRATLSSANQPISELRVQTDTPEFYRAARMSGSLDGWEWFYYASGVIYRYKQGEKTKESLRITFPENSGYRLIRAEIINGNDQPLANVSLSLAAIPRTLSLKTTGRNYRLIYGNEKAGRPQYDLAHYFDFRVPKPVHRILSLGPEEETGNYSDPRPFTERHPEILWSALGLAIVLIGLTALKTLRTPVRRETQN
jgi:Protein of unknown function (DUF3999)